jgi:hypothetical protein
MKMKRVVLSLAVVAGLASYGVSSVSAQEIKPKGVKAGVISAVALNKEGTYCHLTFPAIQPSTLSSKSPKLKSASSGDIVDFYGPCDHDPVGYDEVCRQTVLNSRQLYCND